MRRFETQHLAVFSQQGFDLAQAATGAGGNHQLGGLVTDNAPMAAHSQWFTLYPTAVESLAAIAADAQCAFRLVSLKHLLLQGLSGVLVFNLCH